MVATLPATPIKADRPAAGDAFSCSFDRTWDENFDGWPDGWSRGRGPGFPRYVNVRISQEPTGSDGRCLRIDLDGGGAVAYSPAIPVQSVYGYVVEARVRAEGLAHDRAFLSLGLLDDQRHRLKTFTSEKIRQTDGWTPLRLGPVAPDVPEARLAMVGLHLEPGEQADLTGTARFDDVRLRRTPRIALSANSPLHLYTEPHGIAVTCNASGFADPKAVLTFSLIDAAGRTIAESRQPLTIAKIRPGDHSAFREGESGPNGGVGVGKAKEEELGKGESGGEGGRGPREGDSPIFATRKSPGKGDSPIFATRKSGQSPTQARSPDERPDEPPGLTGSAVWEPPVPGLGFYRVRATLGGDDPNPSGRAETTLAVIEPEAHPAGSEFGWTLPRGGRPLSPAELLRLLDASGVGRVKYPLWFDAADDARCEDAVRLGRHLADRGIELVGLLASPPFDVPDRFDATRPPRAAEIFTAPETLWTPSLETVMARMATGVRRWQLGLDTDTSFVGYAGLAEKIAQIKAALDRVAYHVELGFGWDWAAGPLPAAGDRAPWRFVALSSDPALTPDQLAADLADTRPSETERWVVLKPLSGSHPTDQRAADLVRRMVAAKAQGAEGIFVPDVFGDPFGLVHDDGTPGDLWVPWRTTALLLGGARPLGSLQLPGGSANQLFARGDDMVMVLWNAAPAEEAIYLGRNVRQVDLWGRTRDVPADARGQRIEAGPLPVFVVGLDGPVARWRQGFALADTRLRSVFGRPQRTELRVKNPLDREADGVLTLVGPGSWQVDPPQVRFRLAAGEQLRQPLAITLAYDATVGRHPIQGRFEIRGNPPLRFTAYRQVEVGLGDVRVDLTTRLNDQGELEVRQRLVNRTEEPVSFRCHLFAPQRRRLRTEVLDLGREADVKTYRLPGGSQLVGKTLWLRAEELDGGRVFNYRVVAQP